MRRGFTLIELLAVIVILAIIAVIATPIVLSIIKNSKVSSSLRSTENYLDAVENAIAKENLSGKEFNPLSCTVTTNDGKTLSCKMGDSTIQDLNIDVSGKTIESGAVLNFTKGSVTAVDKLKLDGQEIPASLLNLKGIICKAVTESEKTGGNVPTGQYNYGDEYTCKLGDGEENTFFVIENGDTTSLSKWNGVAVINETDNMGIADTEEVSLIMDRNISTSKLSWISYDDYLKNGGTPNSSSTSLNNYGPITANTYLKNQTNFWKRLNSNQITLPTYSQLNEIITSNNATTPTWLYGNLESSQYGYWLATTSLRTSIDAWFLFNDGRLGSYEVGSSSMFGVRPVITIQKSQLY